MVEIRKTKQKLITQKNKLAKRILLLALTLGIQVSELLNGDAKVNAMCQTGLEMLKDDNAKHNAGIIEVLYSNLKDNVSDYNNINQVLNTIQQADSLYYDLPCPLDWQDYIFEMAEKYEVPAQAMFLIIHQESGGLWTTNGVKSETEDYGLPQINQCNLKMIKENLGYTKDEILNDPYKSIEAEALILSTIMDEYEYTLDDYDLLNICGTYNGWTNWREKEMSIDYVESCQEFINEGLFTENIRSLKK